MNTNQRSLGKLLARKGIGWHLFTAGGLLISGFLAAYLSPGQTSDRDVWEHSAVAYTVERSAMVRIGEDSNGREVWTVVPRVYGEDLSALVDGSRTKFPTMTGFRPGSETVFLNGICLDRGRHYMVKIEDGKGIGIEFVVAPGKTSDGTADRLKIDYDRL